MQRLSKVHDDDSVLTDFCSFWWVRVLFVFERSIMHCIGRHCMW